MYAYDRDGYGIFRDIGLGYCDASNSTCDRDSRCENTVRESQTRTKESLYEVEGDGFRGIQFTRLTQTKSGQRNLSGSLDDLRDSFFKLSPVSVRSESKSLTSGGYRP